MDLHRLCRGVKTPTKRRVTSEAGGTEYGAPMSAAPVSTRSVRLERKKRLATQAVRLRFGLKTPCVRCCNKGARALGEGERVPPGAGWASRLG